MNTTLITGAAGFIGFHLKNALRKDHAVIGIDQLEPKHFASCKRAQVLEGIIQKSIHSSFIDELESKPNLVIHLAAETGISGSLSNPSLYFRQNIEGTFNVLEQCRNNGVRNIIYASSSSVYEPNQAIMSETSPHENQLSFYGTSKHLVEQMVENYCRQFGMTAIGLRFFTVYGSWTRPDMAAYKFMKAIERGEPITLYNNGNVLRDFTHVSDIVHSIECLMSKIKQEPEGSHQIFNIGYGSPVSVKNYAELIGKHLDKEVLTVDRPLPNNELNSTHSDTSKLESYIGYKPICSIESGIIEMTDWFKKHSYDE